MQFQDSAITICIIIGLLIVNFVVCRYMCNNAIENEIKRNNRKWTKDLPDQIVMALKYHTQQEKINKQVRFGDTLKQKQDNHDNNADSPDDKENETNDSN